MLATLARSGSNSYTTGNSQSFDVWGSVRSGSSAVDQKYCANLGHRSDAENQLQYMRARYYDPSTGRFISEDRSKEGSNWFDYAANCPACMVDRSGNETFTDFFLIALVTEFGIAVGAFLPNIFSTLPTVEHISRTAMVLGAAFVWLATALGVAAVRSALALADGTLVKLATKKFMEKAFWAFAEGMVGGFAGGLAYAIVIGIHSGDVMAEVFYIDNFDLF